jgi:hypothetical protein
MIRDISFEGKHASFAGPEYQYSAHKYGLIRVPFMVNHNNVLLAPKPTIIRPNKTPVSEKIIELNRDSHRLYPNTMRMRLEKLVGFIAERAGTELPQDPEGRNRLLFDAWKILQENEPGYESHIQELRFPIFCDGTYLALMKMTDLITGEVVEKVATRLQITLNMDPLHNQLPTNFLYGGFRSEDTIY